jgi:hypothetical protein
MNGNKHDKEERYLQNRRMSPNLSKQQSRQALIYIYIYIYIYKEMEQFKFESLPLSVFFLPR